MTGDLSSERTGIRKHHCLKSLDFTLVLATVKNYRCLNVLVLLERDYGGDDIGGFERLSMRMEFEDGIMLIAGSVSTIRVDIEGIHIGSHSNFPDISLVIQNDRKQ
jgi:hypothetical protein